MRNRVEIIAASGKRRKTVTDDAGKRLRERALTAVEIRAHADQIRAREKLQWFLGLADIDVTK